MLIFLKRIILLLSIHAVVVMADFEIREPCPDNSAIQMGTGEKIKFYSSQLAFSVDPPECLLNKPIISLQHLQEASIHHDPVTNDAIVDILFTEEGKQIFSDYTKAHLQKSIALLVDGLILSMPMIVVPIEDGILQIRGLWYEDAVRLVRSINLK